MVTNIRHGVFETNSSSTHSISISSDSHGVLETLIPDDDGNLTITVDKYFGWEWRRYKDTLTKAQYAAIACDALDKMDMLEEIMLEHTGAKSVEFEFKTDAKGDVYGIDHQSLYGNFVDSILICKSDLKNFIFNPDVWLITGNDNEEKPKFIDNKLYMDNLDACNYVLDRMHDSYFKDAEEAAIEFHFGKDDHISDVLYICECVSDSLRYHINGHEYNNLKCVGDECVEFLFKQEECENCTYEEFKSVYGFRQQIMKMLSKQKSELLTWAMMQKFNKSKKAASKIMKMLADYI